MAAAGEVPPLLLPPPPPPPARIHFGSLEEVEHERRAAALQLGIQRGNINIVDRGATTLHVSDGMQASVQAHLNILNEFERKRRARALHLPTEDTKVKQRLRQLGQPICLFGETPHDRRERLRDIMSRMDETQKQKLVEEVDSDEEEGKEEEFFTPGTEALRQAREALIVFSLPRAKERLELQREQAAQPLAAALQRREEAEKHLKHFTNYGSQFGDERPLSYVAFSPDGQFVVSGSWRGRIKLWSIPHFEAVRAWHGHDARIGSVSFHPQAFRGLSPAAANVVSCCADGSIRLWSLESNDSLAHLAGHKLRVTRTLFHPCGHYIGSASFDTSWRLWDVETRQELLLQEGHSKEVYGLAFHPDGSLAGSCGLDAHALIWDIRSGRRVIDLEGHVKPVFAIDFSPNGFEVVTGGEDNAIRVWDLRARKCRYTVPAHTNLIATLKVDPVRGDYIVSGSYDQTIRAFVSPDWKLTKTLLGHENKIMCVDISADGKYFVSASYDRTIKLWESDPNLEL